jgi:2-methylcitrate dehydratase PrpD
VITSAATQLSAFCSSLRWADVPPRARTRSRELLLDLLGVTVRGSASPSTAPLLAYVQTLPPGRASLLGQGGRTAAPWAALVNGTAAHSTEMDDVARESSLHPGVAVIPAALALAEEREADLSALLTAIVVGYEVAMRVGEALDPAATYRRGFHPTSVAGVFGATAAAASLRGLDATTLTHAFGIAGTLAAGSLEYLSDGSWTKRLNPGWAGHAGIVAASLAEFGFSGPATVFEGRFGLLQTHSGGGDAAALVKDLGRELRVSRVTLKPYGCCRYNHGLIDGVLAIMRDERPRIDEIEWIRLGVLSAGAGLVADPIEEKRSPRNVVDAQFSAPFAAAVAIVHGAAGLEQYVQRNVDDPTIRSLMARTECFRDEELDRVYPATWPAIVEVGLRSGRIVRRTIEHATGEPENPLSRTQLRERFASLVATTLDPAAAAHCCDRVLESSDHLPVRELVASLTQAPIATARVREED